MRKIPHMRPTFRRAYGRDKQPAPTMDIHIVNIDPLMEPAANLLPTYSRTLEETESDLKRGGGAKKGEFGPLPYESVIFVVDCNGCDLAVLWVVYSIDVFTVIGLFRDGIE